MKLCKCKMGRCKEARKRCEGVKVRRCEDVKMEGCEDDTMICVDVKMRRCEDEKIYGCGVVNGTQKHHNNKLGIFLCDPLQSDLLQTHFHFSTLRPERRKSHKDHVRPTGQLPEPPAAMTATAKACLYVPILNKIILSNIIFVYVQSRQSSKPHIPENIRDSHTRKKQLNSITETTERHSFQLFDMIEPSIAVRIKSKFRAHPVVPKLWSKKSPADLLLSYLQIIKHSSCLQTNSFSRSNLQLKSPQSHTKVLTHRHLHTQEFLQRKAHTHVHRDAFIHRRFYTQTLLHTDPFAHRSSCPQTLLHTDPFTHRLWSPRPLYTKTLLHPDAFTRRPVYTQTLLHIDPFTHRRFYAHNPFTHRRFYTHTQAPLHTDAFTHRSLYTQTTKPILSTNFRRDAQDQKSECRK